METSTARAARPAPRIAPRDRSFWEGCSRGELHVIRCDDCGETWYPSQDRCPSCRSWAWSWVPVQTTGTLYTYTVIHGPGTEGRPPGFDAPYPYVVGVVEIDGGEGARIAGNVVGVAPGDVEIGMRVRAVFTPGEAALPDFGADRD
jgi:uncharacterized OB-fold protein